MSAAAVKAGRTDFYPNYMSWEIVQTGADVFTTEKIFAPIPRGQVVSGNRATVMELLWLDCESNNLALNALNEQIIFGLTTGSPPTARTEISSGSTICILEHKMQILTTGGSVIKQPIRHNFQTNDGYGHLLATDSFNAYIDSSNTGITLQGHFRLVFRFVSIPVTEYIGIVQSQQQN